MKKGILISIVLLIGFLSILWLEKPLRDYLSENRFDFLTSKFISGVSIRIILIVAVVFLVQKYRVGEFIGLSTWRKVENPQSVLIALLFIAMGIFGNWDTYFKSEKILLLLFAIYTVIVGILEELFFRGTLFPLFLKSFKNSKYCFLVSAIFSSLLFGLIHFVHVLSQPDNFIGITSQVFFATSIGVFFCGLLVRTENILIPIAIHMLINFSFGAGELSQAIGKTPKFDTSTSVDLNSLIPTTIFFAFIFLGGVYMINKSDQRTMMKKLEKQ